MTKERISELISITREKENLLNEILAITMKQMEGIEEENMDNLSQIIEDKDTLMKKIDKLDLSFITTFSQIKRDNSIDKLEDLSIEDYPNLKELQDAVKEVYTSLTALSLKDEKIMQNMKSKLEKTKFELKKIKKGKRAYKGYSPSSPESILIDEKK